MALMKSRTKDEIPKGAVQMTKEEALEYQLKTVQKWPSSYEVWPLKYASPICGVASMLSAAFVNTHFRRKLKLFSHHRFASYVPTVCLPAIMTTLFHSNFVMTDVLLGETPCPVCVQTRAMAIQVGFGALYPCLLAPISSFMFATRNFTYRLPDLSKNPFEILMIAKKMFKPIHGHVAGFVVLHALLAAFLTHKEYQTTFWLREETLRRENAELE
ncbi:uncharacterized protein LOC134834883 [Culicoides brevitarsis]|uniref:uncharacterized protein LOC134834883 n=1 Tax=Culicoides brevitarsis TaxID=469753 RepID=UPI00307B88CA